MPIRVLLADDHVLLRQGLRRLFEAEKDIAVTGEAATADEAEELAEQLQPDVILMDLEMPGRSGVAAIEAIMQKRPEVGIVVLTMHDADEHLRDALQAGARGYLLKTATAREVVAAVRAVAAGTSLLDAQVTARVLNQFRRLNQRGRADDLPALTEKELSVLRLLAAGKSNKQIAQSLTYSESTVKNRLSVIFEKLGAEDRTQAVIKGVQLGILEIKEAAPTRERPQRRPRVAALSSL